MVSVLGSGARDLGSSPGRDIVLCSWAKTRYSHGISLSTQVYMYKWVLVNLMLENNPAKD